MPGRAIGVQWFSIDKAAHTIGVAMDLPALIRPETTLSMPIKLAGLAPNEEARVVVSAVDVGILNLTNYKVPAPDDYYLGQRKLSAEVRDLYGQLIDGMQGTKGQIRPGGDGGEGELQGSPPTQPPLAFYSGIVTVGPDGTAEVSFDIPAFSGTVRVMAVAWSKDKVGHARLTSWCAIRSWSPPRCRGSCSGATRARFASTSTMSRARPATIRSPSPPNGSHHILERAIARIAVRCFGRRSV